MTGCLWPCVGAAVAEDGAGHRGLFRSKPRTPAEVVQHVRYLVTYVLNNKDGCAGGRRDAKLEHRVTRLWEFLLIACLSITSVYVHIYTLLFNLIFCLLVKRFIANQRLLYNLLKLYWCLLGIDMYSHRFICSCFMNRFVRFCSYFRLYIVHDLLTPVSVSLHCSISSLPAITYEEIFRCNYYLFFSTRRIYIPHGCFGFIEL